MEEFDLYAARRAAEFLHIPLHEVLLDEDELAAGIEDAIRYAETPRSTLVDEMCGLQFVARELSKLNLAAVYSGEGADCILGGLQFALRFVHPQDLPDYTRRRVEVQLPAGLTALQKVFHAISGLDVILPYCSRALATYALSLPIEYRIDRRRLMKVALRSAFAGEIPKEFLFRAKGITRETTHMRYALEKRFGENKYRYFALFKKLVRHPS